MENLISSYLYYILSVVHIADSAVCLVKRLVVYVFGNAIEVADVQSAARPVLFVNAGFLIVALV